MKPVELSKKLRIMASRTSTKQSPRAAEARVPLQICVSQKSSNLLNEGSFPVSVEQLSIFWREKDEDSEWTKANDSTDPEEGYDNSKDEVSSVSSYNPSEANIEFSLRNSLSMQSLSSRLSTSEPLYSQGERPSFLSYSPNSSIISQRFQMIMVEVWCTSKEAKSFAVRSSSI